MASPPSSAAAAADAATKDATTSPAPITNDTTATAADAIEIASRMLADEDAARHEAARKYALGLVENTNDTEQTSPPKGNKNGTSTAATTTNTTVNIRNLESQAARQEEARKYAMSLVANMRKRPKLPSVPRRITTTVAEARAAAEANHAAATTTTTRKRKRGRPRGSSDKGPRKKKKPDKDEPIAQISASDAKTLKRARNKLKLSIERCDESKLEIEKAKKSVERAKKRLEQAEKAAEVAEAAVSRTMDQVADDLLLEPTRWNLYYKKLREFHQKEGHVKFIRRGPPENSKPDLTPAQRDEWEKNYKTLTWWLGRQRTAKRANKLEPYQLILLDRLGVDWNPPQGPTPEKWFAKYEQIKIYKQEFGDTNVFQSYDKQLSLWVKSQRSQYRNAQNGKTPFLSQERIQLLEDIGFDWGEPPVRIPWDDRFEELVQYKQEYGHAHVPWCWTKNKTLAHWVVSQRNKYRDKNIGRNSSLTDEQIEKLESIGFAWNTGGTGRYERDVQKGSEEEV